MARRHLVVPRVALLLLVALIGISCGEIPEPEGFSVATTVGGGGDGEAAQPVESVTTTPRVAPAGTEFIPRADDEYVPDVLISTGQQLLLATAESTRPLDGAFSGIASTHAVDDLLGGVVVQQPGDSGEIVWIPAEGEGMETVDDEGSQLLDVGYASGSPYAVVLVDTSRVDGIRLADGERTPLVILADDEEVIDLSASAGLYAIAIENEQCGELQFYGPEGELLDLDGPSEPDCIVPRRPAFGAVALSPDGDRVVYTVVSYRDDGKEVATELVARNLRTGVDEFPPRKIGEDGDRITALSFDGDRVVYLRESAQQSTVTVLPLTTEAQESPLELPSAELVNSVAFTRLAVASSS